MNNEERNTPIIRIICYGLPYELSRQIFNEFESRWKDARYLINHYQFYSSIRNSLDTVEMLLALSIFHKRIICNLDSAIKFYGTVTRLSKASAIRIGSYTLDRAEKNQIQSVILNYENLLRSFTIPRELFDYNETKELIRKIVHFKREDGKR